METSACENLDAAIPKRKKGLEQMIYKSEKIKKARVEGQQYVNYAGKSISKKEIGNPCTIKRIEVCKQAFLSLHAITHDRVYRLCRLLSCGKSPRDMRGRQAPGNSKPISLVQLIINHIKSFPTKNTHYTGAEKKYLNEKLNIRQMHKMFEELHPEIKVKYSFYYKIFKERFSLSFGRPQVDTCCKCEELGVKISSKMLNDTAKRVAAAEKLVHLRRAKKCFRQMDEIKVKTQNDPTTAGICIDYMQNLFLPQIPIQETFYLHQLTVSVFDIHYLKTGKALLHVYHEGVGRKGPNEVSSFIMNYIKTCLPKNVQHLHIFSDGCGGQNKNHCLIRMCAALVETGRFQSVNQYFLFEDTLTCLATEILLSSNAK
ncbi:hypothetical protein RN001_013130 [Aquatica leii]|uniref:Uncharacterized protein n=1 Tax=Aquatica leii TaxID=1421715 RepID=A0AAN7PZM8_9COLE|nr:hypothetical protein RN001_013130 [Aquatica leii]